MTKLHTFWLPHSVNPKVFRPYGPKTLAILMTGSVHEEVYPIRCWVAKTLKGKHYFKQVERIPDSVRSIDNLRGKDYARLLSMAKIHPTCTSKYQYVVAKFMEIPACNTLLISDYIKDMKDLGFIPGYNFIKYEEDNFLSIVEYYLKNDKEREEISYNGLRLIRDLHTVCVRVREFVQKMDDLFNLKNPRVLFLTIDRSMRTAQHFNFFQEALKSSIDVTIHKRTTNGLLAGQFGQSILSGQYSPLRIPRTNDYDLVITDAAFAYVYEGWAKIKCPKGIIIEDLHRTSPYKTLQNIHKFGADFVAYRYRTPFFNHELGDFNEG